MFENSGHERSTFGYARTFCMIYDIYVADINNIL